MNKISLEDIEQWMMIVKLRLISKKHGYKSDYGWDVSQLANRIRDLIISDVGTSGPYFQDIDSNLSTWA